MEGIMMRGPEITAMAVRNTEGEMIIESFPTETKKRSKFLKLPIIRGVFNYIDSMVLGTKCLMRSAEISVRLLRSFFAARFVSSLSLNPSTAENRIPLKILSASSENLFSASPTARMIP